MSEETREVEQLASFDEVMVWGHEATPASDDAYSKGLGEWVSFAEAVSHNTTIHVHRSDIHCLLRCTRQPARKVMSQLLGSKHKSYPFLHTVTLDFWVSGRTGLSHVSWRWSSVFFNYTSCSPSSAWEHSPSHLLLPANSIRVPSELRIFQHSQQLAYHKHRHLT